MGKGAQMTIIDGVIKDYNERTGELVITAKVDMNDYLRECPKEARIGLMDSRGMTHDQRKKVYALMGEIAEWSGELPERIKELLKIEFMVHRLNGLVDEFSLSDAPKSLVSKFINYVIEFILENGVPTRMPLYEVCDDIEKMIYACLMNKRCAVCQRKAHLHHIDRVGIGRNRHKIDHTGMRCLPLCPDHHVEIHSIGDAIFMDKYHLSDRVKIDDKIIKLYKLGTKREDSYENKKETE